MGWLMERAGYSVKAVHGDTLVPGADEWTTVIGALDERAVKRAERLIQTRWRAPFVEVYATVNRE